MKTLRLGLVALALGAAPASAQELPALEIVTAARPADGTSLASLIERAGAESPLLLTARAEEGAARARIDAARPWRSPTLRGGIANVDVSGARAPTVTTLELSVPIEYDGRIDAELAAASALAEGAAEHTAEATRTLGLALALRYADALEARVHAETGAARVRRIEAILARIERRIALGEGSLLELAAVRLALADARASVVGHEAETRLAERGLAELAGTDARATGSLLVEAPGEPVEAWLARALAARPELRAADRAIEAAERIREARGRARAPELAVYAGWQHSFETLMSLFNQPEFDALLFGVELELPTRLLWDGELREADALVAARTAEREALARQIRREVEAAVLTLEAAEEETAIRHAALEDARTATTLVGRALEVGEESVLTLLSAERVVLDAIEAYQHALAEQARRLVTLRHAAGEPIEAWPAP
jgi:outer membrane protein TolC